MRKNKNGSKDANKQVSEAKETKETTKETKPVGKVRNLNPNFNFRFDWNKLKIYLVVVREGSINAAALKLGLKQSTVSRAISSLEDQIGVPLFRRDNTGSHPTEQGEILYELAKEIETKIHQTGTSIYEVDEKIEGKIHMGLQMGFLGSVWLPSNIGEFSEQYPNVLFDIELGHEDELDSMIPKVDAIIRMGPTKNLDLIQKEIFSGKFVICTTQKYIDKYGIPKDAAELANHRLIAGTEKLLKLGCPPRKQHTAYMRMPKNPQGLLNAALAGNGIALLPQYIVRDHPQLIPILQEVETPTFEIYFCYPQQLRTSKKLRVFREYITEKIQGLK